MSGFLRAVPAALFVLFLVSGCAEPEVPPVQVRPVRVIKVGDVMGIRGREFPGRAAAKDEVELSFQVAGPLISLPVDIGTQVKQGDVIATIDPRDFQTALASAEANLQRERVNLVTMQTGARPEEVEQLKADVAEAEATHLEAIANYDRYKQLLEKKAATKEDYDIALARRDRTAAQLKVSQEALKIGMSGARPEDIDAKRAEIRALEAAVAAAKNQLDYTRLTAPFDGEVAARYVDNFQQVQAKQPVVRLLDVSRIEVTVQIPESVIPLVPLVKQVSCHFDVFGDREFLGHVTKIGSEASQTTRTYPVTVEIEQQEGIRILPGMAVTVRGKLDEGENAVVGEPVVPPSAVFSTQEGQQSYVWVVEEPSMTVSRREVKIGELTPVGLSVLEGLQRGDRVVTAGVNSLRENQQVTILEEGSR
jgi:RND family efflux transporter MFP subunit